MRVLSTLEIEGRPNSRIELWQGDLTDLGRRTQSTPSWYRPSRMTTPRFPTP